MKKVMLFALVLGLASIAYGYQYLTINGEDVDWIALGGGQTVSIEIYSTDESLYDACIGFLNVPSLGDFELVEIKPEAGDWACAQYLDMDGFLGYSVCAAGFFSPPSPGCHFVFQYKPQVGGETEISLFNDQLEVIDSVQIMIIDYGPVDSWDTTVVDNGGMRTSVTVLPSGYPAISYLSSGDLKYAWFDGSAWQTTTIDSAGYVGGYSSLTVLPSGQPAISYYDSTNDNLKYAWHDGSTWQMTTIDSTGVVGQYTSLAILPSGHPAISYLDYTNNDLKYAELVGSDPCNPDDWQKVVVDTDIGGYAAGYTSLAILPSGQPAISYKDRANSLLKYAWYDGSTWHVTAVDTVGWYGGDTSLAILPSGYPAISYHVWTNNDLKYAWYDGSAWQTTTVDSAGSVGFYSSLAILPSGYPAISYYDGTNHDLKYAWYDGSSWYTSTAARVGIVGNFTSLAILPSGQPCISYSDESNWDVMFAVPSRIGPAPVEMDPNYTSIAWTERGGTTTTVNGPAFNTGGDTEYGFASSSVSLGTTDDGHVVGMVQLDGSCGGEPGGWSGWSGDSNGTVAGTVTLGSSDTYPLGSPLNLSLQVLVRPIPSEAEDYHLQLWRGATLLGQVNPGAPDSVVVRAFAGETLMFEIFGSKEGTGDYHHEFEFRMILVGPADLNGDGPVDFRDYAIFALHWLDEGCIDPTWCGKTDLDKSGDVDWPDLKIFTGHWLE